MAAEGDANEAPVAAAGSGVKAARALSVDHGAGPTGDEGVEAPAAGAWADGDGQQQWGETGDGSGEQWAEGGGEGGYEGEEWTGTGENGEWTAEDQARYDAAGAGVDAAGDGANGDGDWRAAAGAEEHQVEGTVSADASGAGVAGNEDGGAVTASATGDAGATAAPQAAAADGGGVPDPENAGDEANPASRASAATEGGDANGTDTPGNGAATSAAPAAEAAAVPARTGADGSGGDAAPWTAAAPAAAGAGAEAPPVAAEATDVGDGGADGAADSAGAGKGEGEGDVAAEEAPTEPPEPEYDPNPYTLQVLREPGGLRLPVTVVETDRFDAVRERIYAAEAGMVTPEHKKTVTVIVMKGEVTKNLRPQQVPAFIQSGTVKELKLAVSKLKGVRDPVGRMTVRRFFDVRPPWAFTAPAAQAGAPGSPQSPGSMSMGSAKALTMGQLTRTASFTRISSKECASCAVASRTQSPSLPDEMLLRDARKVPFLYTGGYGDITGEGEAATEYSVAFLVHIRDPEAEAQRRKEIEEEAALHASGEYPLPPGWSEYYNEEGQPYYYEEATGEMHWEKPPPEKKWRPALIRDCAQEAAMDPEGDPEHERCIRFHGVVAGHALPLANPLVEKMAAMGAAGPKGNEEVVRQLRDKVYGLHWRYRVHRGIKPARQVLLYSETEIGTTDKYCVGDYHIPRDKKVIMMVKPDPPTVVEILAEPGLTMEG